MHAKHFPAALVLLAVLPLAASFAAEDVKAPAPPDYVQPREFSWKSLREPECLFWPVHLGEGRSNPRCFARNSLI